MRSLHRAEHNGAQQGVPDDLQKNKFLSKNIFKKKRENMSNVRVRPFGIVSIYTQNICSK